MRNTVYGKSVAISYKQKSQLPWVCGDSEGLEGMLRQHRGCLERMMRRAMYFVLGILVVTLQTKVLGAARVSQEEPWATFPVRSFSILVRNLNLHLGRRRNATSGRASVYNPVS